MTKSFLASFAIVASITGLARADKRADAQRNLDDARFKACQSARKMIDSKSCPEQAAAAEKIVCSSKTYNDMAALQRACTSLLKDKAAAAGSGARGSGAGSAAAAPKCTITSIAGNAVSLVVPITHSYSAETWCKTSVRKVAEQWLADNASCERGKTTFPYSFAWGAPGKQKTFDQSGFCPTSTRADTKTDTKDTKDTKDKPVRCLVISIGGKDVTPPIEIDWSHGKKWNLSEKLAESSCQNMARKPVIEWAKANGVCNSSATFVATFGQEGHEKTLDAFPAACFK